MALSPKRILTHMQLQRMTYNKKGNPSSLLRATATSGMLLPTMREVILTAARMVDLNIIDAIGDQRWHRVHVHVVDLQCYDRKPGSMELIQREIEKGAEDMKLVWTPRWLLSRTAMEAILADPEKRTAGIKITVMNTDDKDKIIRYDI